MYAISTRAFTAAELARLRRQLRLTADDVAWMLFPSFGLAGAGFLVGRMIEWIASKSGVQTGSLPTYALTSVLGLLGLVGSILLVRGFIRSGRSLRREIRANAIEDVYVENVKAVRIGSAEDEVPMLLFDIGDNKLLCLMGQWMYHSSLFEPGDAIDAFPSDSFRVSRLPDRGSVVGVQVLGRPLGALREVTLSKAGLTKMSTDVFKECAIVGGTLGSLTEKPGGA